MAKENVNNLEKGMGLYGDMVYQLALSPLYMTYSGKVVGILNLIDR